MVERFVRPAFGLGIASALIGIASASLAPLAIADPWGGCEPGDGGCKPDNTGHTFCFTDSMDNDPRVRDAANYAMNNMDQQTQLYELRTMCTDQTDAVFREVNLVGLRGEYECLDLAPDGPNTCNRAAIRIDNTQIIQDGPEGKEQLNREKTACHEVGHSLGMAHHVSPYDDCMVNGRVSQDHRDYNQHHREHINDANLRIVEGTPDT